jgi:hypothetical protein
MNDFDLDALRKRLDDYLTTGHLLKQAPSRKTEAAFDTARDEFLWHSKRDMQACLAVIDRLKEKSVESIQSIIDASKVGQEVGYRRGLEDSVKAVQETRYNRWQPQQDFIDAIRALMDTPQEDGDA